MVAAISRRSPTTPSSGMRLGLCAQLKRLWMRLVTSTVLPERLKPVTARETAALPASSPRLSRSEACAKIGESQLKFSMDGIPNPIAHVLRVVPVTGTPRRERRGDPVAAAHLPEPHWVLVSARAGTTAPASGFRQWPARSPQPRCGRERLARPHRFRLG